jgi:hypothetical protein
MNMSEFLNKQNIAMLWDVISDEEIFKYLTRDIQSKIANLFSENIKGFFEIERTKTNNLIDLNKKYILLILNYIRKNYPYQPNKIKIYEELPVKEFITAEEIQNERKTQFEKDLQDRQQEFENIINVKVPPVPEFADKYEDSPISEMDKIIKEMTAKRNYDIEQINYNYTSDINQANNWLKSQETSLKTEKFTPQKINDETTQNYSRFKFLNNIDEINSEKIEINKGNSPQKKNVTWGENREINNKEEINNDIEENIFLKLKKVEKKVDKHDNINFSIKEITNEERIINEERIVNLENEIKALNNKIDIIISLLKQN